MPSPNIIAAGLARRTKDTAIVVLGNSIALYNPPVRVAEEFAMLDCISGGRLVAGFPVGTSMDTNYCYGQIPALTREKYNEAHDLILRAWTEPDPFAFNGRYTQLRYVNIWPRPLQQPRPPIRRVRMPCMASASAGPGRFTRRRPGLSCASSTRPMRGPGPSPPSIGWRWMSTARSPMARS